MCKTWWFCNMDFHCKHHAQGTWVAPTFLCEIVRAGVDTVNFLWIGTDLAQPVALIT